MTEALTPFHITWIPIFDFFKGVFYKVYHMPLNVTIDLEYLLIMIPLVLSQMENIHLLLAKWLEYLTLGCFNQNIVLCGMLKINLVFWIH